MQGSKHTSCDVHECLPKASDWERVDMNAVETVANDLLIFFFYSTLHPFPIAPLQFLVLYFPSIQVFVVTLLPSLAVFSGASSLPSHCSPLTLYCQSLLIIWFLSLFVLIFLNFFFLPVALLLLHHRLPRFRDLKRGHLRFLCLISMILHICVKPYFKITLKKYTIVKMNGLYKKLLWKVTHKTL